MNWISVKDSLPAHAERNIVALWDHPDFGQRISLTTLDKKHDKPYWHFFGGRSFTEGQIQESQCVTHWLRLPELPSQEMDFSIYSKKQNYYNENKNSYPNINPNRNRPAQNEEEFQEDIEALINAKHTGGCLKDVAFFTRMIGLRVSKTVGYLKLVNGESGDTFPLKLIDTVTGQTKQLLNHENKEEMKALRIAVREYNKKKDTV